MINLLPPDHREYIEYGRKNARALNWMSALLFGIAVLFVVAIVGRLTIQTAKDQAVDQKNAIQTMIEESDLGSVEKEYTVFVNGLSSTRKVYEKQILYSRLIRKLATLLPPGTSLTTIALSDKDRAINLNFDNQVDGLGPTIQINLLNQGDQIAEEGRILTEKGFKIPLGGTLTNLKNGTTAPEIFTNTKTKQLDYYVNINDEDTLQAYTKALTNGGEYAYALLYPVLVNAGSFNENSANTPYIYDYSVNNDAKSIDYKVEASNLDQVTEIQKLIDSAEFSTVIETYAFEDRTYTLSDNCTRNTQKRNCASECPNGLSECSDAAKQCRATVSRGCRYVIRAYYDELYTSAQIQKLSDMDKRSCQALSSLPCTHKVTAKYNQLFEKVDINRVSSCAAIQTDGQLSCPVEIRAEFGQNAKFYLINGSGS